MKLPTDIYKASLGHDPKKWERWYKANGFTVDKKTNRLKDGDGKLWRINTDTKSLEMVEEGVELPQFNNLYESVIMNEAMSPDLKKHVSMRTGLGGEETYRLFDLDLPFKLQNKLRET
jgi:hypothetical protein